jgi:osmotically-inducible protein OsmY
VAGIGLTGCASTHSHIRTEAQYKTDKQLAGDIKTVLKHDPTDKYPDVTVNLFRGRVQLSGYASTEG